MINHKFISFSTVQINDLHTFAYRDFINISCRRETGFHRKAKLSKINYFISSVVKIGEQIVLTAGQFAQCPALNKNSCLIPSTLDSLSNGSSFDLSPKQRLMLNLI